MRTFYTADNKIYKCDEYGAYCGELTKKELIHEALQNYYDVQKRLVQDMSYSELIETLWREEYETIMSLAVDLFNMFAITDTHDMYIDYFGYYGAHAVNKDDSMLR